MYLSNQSTGVGMKHSWEVILALVLICHAVGAANHLHTCALKAVLPVPHQKELLGLCCLLPRAAGATDLQVFLLGCPLWKVWVTETVNLCRVWLFLMPEWDHQASQYTALPCAINSLFYLYWNGYLYFKTRMNVMIHGRYRVFKSLLSY